MRLVSLQVGMPKQTSAFGKPLITAIDKNPVDGPVYLSSRQLAGDAQADLVHHGGPDKAVCVYCTEHYPYWEEKLSRKLKYGAFGENFTVSGLREDQVCIGDIYEIGEAVVQVSQPRQPCFKLGNKHNRNDLPLLVQDTGYTGYYFRVLKEGHVSAGLMFRLAERHPAGVTVACANKLKYHDKRNTEGIRQLLDVAELSDSWRTSFLQRLRTLEE